MLLPLSWINNGMMMKRSPPSDNEIESPPPIPDPSGSDDASDPELLEEEEVMDAPAQCPPCPMTLCGGVTEFDEDYLNGWEVIWQDDLGFEHGLPPFFLQQRYKCCRSQPHGFFQFSLSEIQCGVR